MRALILGEELQQLPARFNAFADEQRQVNKRVESDIEDIKTGVRELQAAKLDLRPARRNFRLASEGLRHG